MIKKNFVFLFLATALSGLSLACIASECLTKGSWAGTIGNASMTMEFQEVTIYSDTKESEQINGRYYYKNNLSDLILKQNNTKNGWDEYDTNNQTTGHIDAFKCDGDLLTAQWQSADKKTTLPLVASRVKGYSSKRLEKIQFAVSAKVFNHRQYQMISLPKIKSKGLLLIGKYKGIKKINQHLKEEFRSDVEAEIECVSFGRMGNRDFESESTYSVIDWNNAFITISYTLSNYCGGMHPNIGESKSVYNLITGELQNTSLWLNNTYQTENHNIEKETPLGKLLSKAYLKQRVSTGDTPQDAESCLDSINFYSTGLWTNGKEIFFKPDAPYIAMPCTDEIELTYKQVEPFLSPAGKSAVRASIQK